MAKTKAFKGKSVVITGKLKRMSRTDARKRIENLGGKVCPAVSKNTDYVIAGERPGSRLARAKILGVPVLTENQFILAMRKGN